MSGTATRKIAIVGAGPAGLYALEHLLEQEKVPAAVDIFDRLPNPWGLVRNGVAPDHPDKKQVIDRLFRFSFDDERVRFFGSVEIGRDIDHAQLAAAYDAVLYTVGSDSDNALAIPGEDLTGVLSARRLVGWYNGHPDHAGLDVRLDCRRAVVVGNGNVALDVARILAAPPAISTIATWPTMRLPRCAKAGSRRWSSLAGAPSCTLHSTIPSWRNWSGWPGST